MLYGSPTPEQVELVDFDATLIDLKKAVEFFDNEIAGTEGLLELDNANDWVGRVLEKERQAKKISRELSNLTVLVEGLRDEYYYLLYDNYYDNFPTDANWMEN